MAEPVTIHPANPAKSSPQHEVSRQDRWLARVPTWLPFVVVGLAAAAAYFNALWNGFALDDFYIVATNARVHHLTNLRDI
ncbi:MAG: hypothetical protein ACRELX_08930, partial [Longimicrobiales bacterium]